MHRRVRDQVGRGVAVAALAAGLLAARDARSQAPPAADIALAETLFAEGKQLMAAGRHADACPKLAESQRLDPGGGTLMNLAACHEAIGKTASAWAEYGEVVVQAQQKGRADIAKTAKQRADALFPKLSRLVVEVPAAAKHAGLEVQRDGSRVDAASFGVEMPLDPGPHKITATAPGKTAWSVTIDLGDKADRKVVTVPPLADAPVAVGSASAPVASVTTGAPPPPPPPVEGPKPARARDDTFAWVATGVAVVGLGSAAFFGLRSKSKEDEAKKICPDTACRDAEAVDASKSGVRAANYANIAGGIGLVGGGVAVYLFTRTDPAKASGYLLPVFGPSSAGLTAGRSF